MRRQYSPMRGFTLLELVIALAVLSVLVVMASRVVKLQVQRQKEADLRLALREIRSALDAYKRAVDDGKIRVSTDASGYPPSLDALVTGVADATDAQGKRLYFMRRIPRDPMAADAALSNAQTWGLRSYDSPADAPAAGADVFDVFSQSERRGLNGAPYRDW